MEGLPSSIGGWLWWLISVVIVGILINLASSFLYPKVESQLAKISETRQRDLEQKKAEFQKKVEEIKANPSKMLELKMDLVLLYLRTIITIVAGLIALTILPFVFELFFNFLRFNLFLNVSFLAGVTFAAIVFLLMIIILPKFNESRYIRSLIKAASNTETN